MLQAPSVKLCPDRGPHQQARNVGKGKQPAKGKGNSKGKEEVKGKGKPGGDGAAQASYIRLPGVKFLGFWRPNILWPPPAPPNHLHGPAPAPPPSPAR